MFSNLFQEVERETKSFRIRVREVSSISSETIEAVKVRTGMRVRLLKIQWKVLCMIRSWRRQKVVGCRWDLKTETLQLGYEVNELAQEEDRRNEKKKSSIQNT